MNKKTLGVIVANDDFETFSKLTGNDRQRFLIEHHSAVKKMEISKRKNEDCELNWAEAGAFFGLDFIDFSDKQKRLQNKH